MNDGVERFRSSDGAGVELRLIDLDPHGGSFVRLVEMSQASVRKPTSMTDVAPCERSPGYRLSIHLNGAERAFRLRASSHASTTARRLLKGQVIFYEAIDFSGIEPQPMA